MNHSKSTGLINARQQIQIQLCTSHIPHAQTNRAAFRFDERSLFLGDFVLLLCCGDKSRPE